MEIKSPKGNRYQVGKKFGNFPNFSVYVCTLQDGRECILKIVNDVKSNSMLQMDAFLLSEMNDNAIRLESEYRNVRTGNEMLNYNFFFPALVESFCCDDQGGRWVNVISFFHVAKELWNLLPLAHIASREKARVDPKTSAWILGKLLKLLVFTHDQKISHDGLSAHNILINRESHYVSIFDWSTARTNGGNLSLGLRTKEIAIVAKVVIQCLGGDLQNKKLLPDPQLADDRYEKFLFSLVSGSVPDADKAHAEFYKLIKSFWGREFWPYTTYSLNGRL